MTDTVHLDATDRVILGMLTEDARATKAEMARQVGVTPNAVHERIRKLEAAGVIAGYHARLDPRVLGRDMLAFIFVAEVKPVRGRKTGPQLATLPSVEEVHKVAGEDCFLLKARVAGTGALGGLLDAIGAIDTVGQVRTTIVLDTLAEHRSTLLDDTDAETV